MSNRGNESNMMPIVGVIVVAVILLALAYANITGMFQISGAQIVNKNTAFIIVVVLFILTLPWVYRRAKG